MKRPPDRPDPARLLEAFVASDRSDKAFAALVGSLQGLVYTSALRRTGDAQVAEEVAQNVFALMARKADSLRKHPSLTAWALKTTQLQSATAMRGERRRQRKLAALGDEARTRGTPPPNTMDDQASWKDAVPFLDEALDRLSPEDQKVILQRFYEEKKFKEIASQNGQTESACKKRVQRALQKLSSMLTSRGVTLSGTAVASLLGAEFARAVPAHTAATLAPQALAASSSVSNAALLANTFQTMSTLKSTSIATVAVLALAIIPISQQLAEAKRLRLEVESIEAQAGDDRMTQRLSKLPRNKRSDRANLPSRRAAANMLDELAAPVNHRALVKQLLAADSSHLGEGSWEVTMAFAQLNRMSKDELVEFFNVFDDYPASALSKRLTKFMMRMRHPGAAESHQDTLERMMRRGGEERPVVDAMNVWIKDDPDAAIAWFREKTATGEILGEGLSDKFEKDTFESLVATLAKSRPREAFEIFEERPPELRTPEMIDRLTRSLAKVMIESGDDTYVRRMFEQHDRSEVLRDTLYEFSHAFKFGEGMAFLEQYVTDPEQRNGYIIDVLVEQRGVNRNDAALEWVYNNTPAAEAPGLFRRLGAGGAILGDWQEKQRPGDDDSPASRRHLAVVCQQARVGIIEHEMESEDFSGAFHMSKRLRDRSLRAEAQEQVGRAWLRHDEAEATQKLPQSLLNQIQDQ